MIIYISGPMTGIPENNVPAFNAAAQLLRDLGHKVISPAEIQTEEQTWEAYLRADIKQLMDAEAVAVLPGWVRSRGACLEIHIAQQLGMQVKPIEDFQVLQREVG